MSEINGIQFVIMEFVTEWVDREKTPVPKKEIINFVTGEQKVKGYTVLNAIYSLIRKKYIRRSQIGWKTTYVKCRSI